MDFDETVQTLIIYSVFVKYLRKKQEYNGAEYKLFRYFKEPYKSVRREVLYKILFEFGVGMKVIRLTPLCLYGTRSNFGNENMSDTIPM